MHEFYFNILNVGGTGGGCSDFNFCFGTVATHTVPVAPSLRVTIFRHTSFVKNDPTTFESLQKEETTGDRRPQVLIHGLRPEDS